MTANITAGTLTQKTGFPWFSRKWDTDTGIPDLTGKVRRTRPWVVRW